MEKASNENWAIKQRNMQMERVRVITTEGRGKWETDCSYIADELMKILQRSNLAENLTT